MRTIHYSNACGCVHHYDGQIVYGVIHLSQVR